jgi:hypothetical protein
MGTVEELKELHKAPDRGLDVERISMECMGCVIRMDQTTVAKEVTEGKTEGGIKARGPRLG